MKWILCTMTALIVILSACGQDTGGDATAYLLRVDDYRHYVDYFNRMEDENIVQAIPNSEAWDWMKENIPLFECPQDNFEEIWYYRWWTLRKHIRETPQGYVITEFLVPRPYADRYNMISSALGHHIFESRWLHDREYLDDDIHVWYRGNNGGEMQKLRSFSSWTAWALYNRYLVDGDREFLLDMLSDLDKEYHEWESDHRLPSGLFWQYDVRDGMEEQISGGRHVKNARPTINSYMYGNAVALSRIAGMAGKEDLQNLYRARADTMKRLVEEDLWNADSTFFETLWENGKLANVREAIGFLPWYVNLPDPAYDGAWKQVMDPQGFLAPFGLTTAERRSPYFRSHGCCTCEWDGAIFPFATAQTLTAMANLLNSGQECPVNGADFFRHMELYVESQYYRGRPYIGEYLDETTGYWLKGDQERSRYYNHSTCNDLVITGIVGLRPRDDGKIVVNPLVPEDKWDWFCLDRVPYHGHILTIFWDRDGKRYNRGKGFHVLFDGREAASSERLEKLTGTE